MESIVKNICNIFKEKGINGMDSFFCQATESQIDKLRNLVGDNVDKVLEFYGKYQPVNVPQLPCYLKLLDIEAIIEENSYGEPSMYLSKYGVITFGVTAGGNAVCLDTNNAINGDPAVLIADSAFCYYDDDSKEVLVSLIPEEVEDQFDLSEPIVMNYDNIKLCLKKINDSFVDFLMKISENYYQDIEEYLA